MARPVDIGDLNDVARQCSKATAPLDDAGVRFELPGWNKGFVFVPTSF
jgi:hypothetical protein